MEIIFALVAVGFVVLVGAVVINRATPGSEPLIKMLPPEEVEFAGSSLDIEESAFGMSVSDDLKVADYR